MDKFEKYILSQKEGLDSETPQDQIWERISAKLDEQQGKQKQVRLVPITRLWQVAAVFVGIIVCMVGFQIHYNTQLNKHLASNSSTEKNIAPNLDNLTPELAEAEQFYFMQINEKRKELQKYTEGGKADGEIDKYLSELDVAYKDLKNELSVNNNEQVMSELIRNLQIRIDLLNQQLEVLKQIEKIRQEKKGKSL
jgi:hypothetical protein